MDHEGLKEMSAEELREIASDGGELVVDSSEVANSLVACGFKIKSSSEDGSEFVLQVKAEDDDRGRPGEASRLSQAGPVDSVLDEESQEGSFDDLWKALRLSETGELETITDENLQVCTDELLEGLSLSECLEMDSGTAEEELDIVRNGSVPSNVADVETNPEASVSGEVLDRSRCLEPSMNIRCTYGTGKEEVEQITQSVSEFASCFAGRSDSQGSRQRGQTDGILNFMLAEVEYMLGSSELRDTPLCCSFLLRCAQEYEATFRPRLALAQYKKAQELCSKDPSNMKDLLVRANAGVEKLMASGIAVTEAGSCPRAWDSSKLFSGPYCATNDDGIWNPEWVIEAGDGRESFRDFAFSFCDFAEKESGGDRKMYRDLILLKFYDRLLRVNPQIEGTPLHCCMNLHCANELKKIGRLDEAVKLYGTAWEMAARDPELNPEMEQTREELVKIFSSELQIIDACEVRYDRQRLMELLDFPVLFMIGHTLLESLKIEEARKCFGECLVQASSCSSDECLASTVVLYQLSRTYMLQRDVGNALDFLEQTRLSAEVEDCQCISFGGDVTLTQVLESIFQRLKYCPKHHLLPKILLEKGRLQRYECYSFEEVEETFKKGLELAKECNNNDLLVVLLVEVLQIYSDQWNNMDRYMSGNFRTPKSDQRTESLHAIQDHISDLERRKFPPMISGYDTQEANIVSEAMMYHLKYLEAAPLSDDDFKHKLERAMKILAKLQEIHASAGLRNRDNLVKAHIEVISSLVKWTGSSLAVIKPHFQEAFNCVSSAYEHREDEHALEAQLLLGSYAIQPKIKGFDEALVLFKRVLRVLNQKKLPQLTTRKVEVFIRVRDMTKHAYSLLIYTYTELAMRAAFEVKENGIRCIGRPASLRYADPDLMISHMQKSLLWAERSKGRLLTKLLDPPSTTVTSTSEAKADTIHVPSNDDHHSPTLPEVDVGISERKFYNDDDWAMNFLVNGAKFLHHGSRMLFVAYTMYGPDGLDISVVNGEDGTILAFFREDLNTVVDEKTQKLAEDEMVRLVKGLRGYKNSDEHPAGERVIPPSLYAMNEPGIRMRYYDTCITGMVARIQRLACEAVEKRQHHKKSESETREIDDVLQKLYDILIPFGLAEVLRQLFEQYADCTLVFVPHEDLNVVPFQALRDRDGKYLVEKYPVSVSPSMWITRHCQHLYDKQLQTPGGPELLVGRRAATTNFSELPKAHEEIASIKRYCGQKALEVLDSGDVSKLPMKERVMEHAQTASWAHFAVHGEISDRFPHGSLVLDDDDDMDRWRSDEITAAGLPCARSVVLSACQSGLGTLGGVLDFARDLVIAGVPSCVLGMWQVDEEFTLLFMQQLYKHLHDGEDLAHAMQKSTKIMIQELNPKRWPADPVPQSRKWSVLDWAVFSCIGYGGVKFPSTSADGRHGRMVFRGNLSPWYRGSLISACNGGSPRAFGFLNFDPDRPQSGTPRPTVDDPSTEGTYFIPWFHVMVSLLNPPTPAILASLQKQYLLDYEQSQREMLRPSTSASTVAKASTLPRRFHTVEDSNGKGKTLPED